MEIVLLFIRIFLFAVFALAGIAKLVDLEGSKKTLRDFGVDDDVAEGLAVALPVAELFFAVMLLPLWTAWFGAIGVFLLLIIFIGAMIWQLAQGKTPDCHCFGAIHSEPVSKKSLIRNIIFAILAFFLILQGYYGQGLGLTDLDNEMAIQLILGLTSIGLLGAIVFYLRKISEQQTQIMRRIEVIELLSHEGGRKAEREEAGDIDDKLPVGALISYFQVKDLNGKTVSSEEILSKNKPKLFFFVSPSCGPCEVLMPEIEQWQEELKHKVDFIFISRGQAKENAEKFGGKTFKQIFLQEEKEISEIFKAKWTPTAIFVNSEGTIGSKPAVGDEAIRELIEKIKAENAEKMLALVETSNGNGAKIGENVPDFSLKDLNGREITAKDLQGRKTLITFWNMNCPFCVQMLPALQKWEKEKSDSEPELIVFSEGKAEMHQELGLKSPVLLDEGREMSNKLGMNGTPSAILVNENGIIVSETAVGAIQIWELIGRRETDFATPSQ
jgi:thiol-disulfide isomerase/thioredoxin/uncharacterized membrane protein YphA (DoxX/SURF4 family)